MILDKYSYGAVKRISPEAPIPILAVEREFYRPGGAGNAAANLATLGAEVDLFGIVGDDHHREALYESVAAFGIRCRLVTDESRHTIVKQRLLSVSQQLLRVDYEMTGEIAPSHLETLEGEFDPPYDAILVSDYAKGTVCRPLMDFLGSLGAPIFVDPKPRNLDLYRGVDLVKPNAKECLEMTGVSDDIEGADILSRRLETAILLTRGGKGMAFVDSRSGQRILAETEAKDVVDVTGAGDTVIATYLYFRCLGFEPGKAISAASSAAGIAVTRVGCYQVTREDMRDYLR